METRRLTDNWEHYRGSLGGIWEVWRQDKLNNHYNVPWQKVTLPHCYNGEDSVDPDRLYYEGPGWYRTKLKVNNPYARGRTLLHFEGAGQRSEVYVYTQKAGSHAGGYDEFTVDITDAVAAREAYGAAYGELTPVAVSCDNTRDLETIPSDVSDFNLYGGLYRYVNLVYVPEVSLQRVHVETVSIAAESAEVCVKACLYNPNGVQRTLRAAVTVRGPGGETVCKADVAVETRDGFIELARLWLPNPSLWSPDAPHLYACEVTLRDAAQGWETAVLERFGLRRFEFQRKGPFLLNGERLLLRGTHRHEDFAGVAAAMTEEMTRAEMKLMKEMGVNFIRLGHYQQSRIVLDLCDELGILVWEEIPWCRGGIGGDSYRQMCSDMLTAMIEQHYNHPSVILWGLGNENDWEADFDRFDQEEIRAFMRELHELSHELDDSRLTAIRRCEFCKDIIDVYSPSIWAGWYRGIYPEYEAYSRAGFEGAERFFHMEWGADNLAGRHAEKPYTGFSEVAKGQGADERDGDYLLVGGDPRVSSLGDWSETYFCDMIDWYLGCQERMDWLTGTAQWAFKDFSTPVRPDSPIPYMNLKGVVQRDLTPKEAYYVFQSYWTEEPMVRLYGHTMPVRWGRPGEKKTIRVYSNCPQAELFVDGVSQGVKQRDSRDFPCAGLRWEVALAAGAHRVRVVAEKDGVTVADELEFTYQTEACGEPAKLELRELGRVRVGKRDEELGRERSGEHDQTGTGECVGELGQALVGEYAQGRERVVVTVEAAVYDANGVFCPDAADFVRFGFAGDGKLCDNLGTPGGSRYRQLANGRAHISAELPPGGAAVVSVSAAGLPTAFLAIK